MSGSAPPCSATAAHRAARRHARAARGRNRPSRSRSETGRPAHRSPRPAPARPSGAAAGQVRRSASRAVAVLGIDRRAKYLLLRLDDGHTLIAHLGMSGRMTLHDAASAAEHPFERHDHVVFETEEGWQVRFNDARRFGLMLLAADEAVPKHKLFKGLGPEPLDDAFDGAALAESSQGKHARRSRPPCSIRRPWSASATSTPARRCSWPASRRVGRPTRSRASAPTGWSPPSSRCCCARSTMADRPCAIMCSRAASWAIFRRASMSTTAPGAVCPTRGCGKVGASPGAVRPLDLLLRALPALAKSGAHIPGQVGGGKRDRLRKHPDRNQGPGRHHPPQSAQGAERALRRAGARARAGARRLRSRSRRSAASCSPAARRPSPPAPTSRR